MKMVIKKVFVIAFTFFLVVQWTEAAPSYTRDVEDFENTATFDLAKRLLGEERVLQIRLRDMERIRRVKVCGPGEGLKGLKCVKKRVEDYFSYFIYFIKILERFSLERV